MRIDSIQCNNERELEFPPRLIIDGHRVNIIYADNTLLIADTDVQIQKW